MDALARGAEVVRGPDSAPETIRRLAAGCDGVLTRSKLPDDLFSAAPRVRAVVVHGTGTDLVPLEQASAHGVLVANLPGINAQSVAEYCAMAMLMLARNVLTIVNALKVQAWDQVRALDTGAREIAAMTLGVVGVGEIGRRVAHIALQGFGMRVLGHQRRLDRLPAGVRPATLEELLAVSDFVVLACPLTAETRHLINARTLKLMKPGAWLVNVGRGPVVHEAALVEALRAKHLGGAMLDVYENYRLEPENPLRKLDNVILTPHLSAVTRESRARAGVAAAAEMLRMLAGERPLNLVNPEALNAKTA
jgi:D-3-phosphoglycerate dehydrogenase